MKRLRYSMTDEQWKLLEELAKAFALDTKTVLAFSASLGLRFLDISLVHPLAGLGKAIEERGELEGAAVFADVEKAIAQGTSAKQLVQPPEVAGASKQEAPRKRAPYKRK